MGNILNRLVNGSAKTFNQHTNVQLDNLYTVLDISELTGELLPVGMFVALDYVWDKAKEDRTKEKAIFIDEAWELIGDDDTNNPNNTKALAGEWVQEIFKIIRGYGGAAIAATQDIGDLDRSRFGKGILNVAKTKIILNLENDEAQRVQHILHLSDAEIMSITRFERGQGLISTNSNHITVSFKASPLEKQLITTDRMHSIANELNLVSVTGWHSVFLTDDSMIYMYRQCLWLSMSLTYEDLLTMLKECISEYKRGKGRLTTGKYPTDPVA